MEIRRVGIFVVVVVVVVVVVLCSRFRRLTLAKMRGMLRLSAPYADRRPSLASLASAASEHPESQYPAISSSKKKNTMNRDPSIQSAQCKFTTSTEVTGIPRIPGIPVPITGDQIIQTKSNQQRVINVTRGPVSRTGSRLEIIDRNSMRLSLNGFNLLNESSAGSRAFDWSNGPVRPVPSTPISSSPPLDVTEFFIFRFFFYRVADRLALDWISSLIGRLGVWFYRILPGFTGFHLVGSLLFLVFFGLDLILFFSRVSYLLSSVYLVSPSFTELFFFFGGGEGFYLFVDLDLFTVFRLDDSEIFFYWFEQG